MNSERLLSQLFVRMCLCVSLLLLGWLSFLGATTAQSMYADRVQESKVRGRMLALELARSISRAVDYGIPVAQLQGVEQVFSDRIRANPDVAEIALTDAGGTRLLPSKAPLEGVTPLSVTIQTGQGAAGSVIVYMRPIRLVDVLILPLSAAVALFVMAYLVLAEVLRFSLGRRLGHRELIFRQALRLAAARDYTRIIREPFLQAHDRRSALLSVLVRDLNERFTRLSRLIKSLQETEPTEAKRSDLARLALNLQGVGLFAPSKPGVERVPATLAQRQWLMFLLILATAAHLFGLSMPMPLGADQGTLLVLLGLICAGASWRLSGHLARTAPHGGWPSLLGMVATCAGALGALIIPEPASPWTWVLAVSFFLLHVAGSVALTCVILPMPADNPYNSPVQMHPWLLTAASAVVVAGILAMGLPGLLGQGSIELFSFLLTLITAVIFGWLTLADIRPGHLVNAARSGQATPAALALACVAYVLATAAPLDAAPALQAHLAREGWTWCVPLLGAAFGVIVSSWWPRVPRMVHWPLVLVAAALLGFLNLAGSQGPLADVLALCTVCGLVWWLGLGRLSALMQAHPTHSPLPNALWAGALLGWGVSWFSLAFAWPAWLPGALFVLALAFMVPQHDATGTGMIRAD